MFSFNLGLFSKYRAELMGVATLMIIICHSPIYVTMPGWLVTIFSNGGAGCDVFLFLSGMGMYNSFTNHRTKSNSILSWYWKRYVRIIIPCTFFIIGLWLYKGNWNNTDWVAFFTDLSGFYYLTGHSSLWFVSCALLLYVITPLIHVPLTGDKRWCWLCILCYLSLLFWYVDLGDSSLIHNWQFCVSRFPSYFIGYTLAIYIKEKRESNVFVFVLLPLLLYCFFFVLNHTVGTNFSLFWTQGIPIVVICAILLDRMRSKVLRVVLASLGGISLESYATNVLVLPNLRVFGYHIIGFVINPNSMAFYILGTLICLGMAYCVSRLSKIIIVYISQV